MEGSSQNKEQAEALKKAIEEVSAKQGELKQGKSQTRRKKGGCGCGKKR